MARVKRVESRTEVAYDPDGNEYTLYESTPMLDAGTFGDPHAEAPGLKELRTSDGRAVNYLGPGRYEIVGHPNIPLTSVNPKAR